jgi:hypothetical protein
MWVWAFAVLFLVSAVSGAAGPADTGIIVNYGPTPTAMPYNGGNGYAVVGAAQVATSQLNNNFNAAIRGDMYANTGGGYNGTEQSGYFSFNSQDVMLTQGQAIGYFGWVGGYGKGNAIFANGGESCYGGGEAPLPSSTPECAANGEFESDQGTYVWSGTVAGSPSTGATTIGYSSPTNNAILGSRAILNLNHTTGHTGADGGTGVLASFTGCSQGSGGVCPGTCPLGVGSECTVVQFTSTAISTTAGLHWYFKTGSEADYYNPPCNGDDVELANAGGASVGKCVGHWYQVATVNSATEITLTGVFDTGNLGEYIGTTEFMLVQGIEATDVSQTADTVTIPSNSFTWSNGDFLYSPPSHYMGMIGLNLIFTKQYMTGLDSAPSRGIRIANFGPQEMDTGVQVTGGGAGYGVNGGFRTGVSIENLNIRTSGPSGVLTNDTRAIDIPQDVNILIDGNNGQFSPPKNVIALGGSGQSEEYYSADAGALTFNGVHTQFAVGVYNDGAGFKHARVSSGSVGANSIASVEIAWTTAFADTDYTPTCTIIDATGNLRVLSIDALVAADIYVQVFNSDVVNPHTGTIACVAVHD